MQAKISLDNFQPSSLRGVIRHEYPHSTNDIEYKWKNQGTSPIASSQATHNILSIGWCHVPPIQSKHGVVGAVFTEMLPSAATSHPFVVVGKLVRHVLLKEKFAVEIVNFSCLQLLFEQTFSVSSWWSDKPPLLLLTLCWIYGLVFCEVWWTLIGCNLAQPFYFCEF